MGSGSSTFDGDEKWNHYRLQLFPMLDSRINEKQEFLCYAAKDTIRVRALKNFLDWTNYKTFAVKFSSCLISYTDRLTSSEALVTAPRPKGLDKTTSRRYFNWGVVDNMKNILVGVLQSGSGGNDAATREDSAKMSEDTIEKIEGETAKVSKSKKKKDKPKASNIPPDGKAPTENKDDE
jgi:hypothetical protein